MVATPFLYDSFIHYFTPVYPDAIHDFSRALIQTQHNVKPPSIFQLKDEHETAP
jgi:hypothetical protein